MDITDLKDKWRPEKLVNFDNNMNDMLDHINKVYNKFFETSCHSQGLFDGLVKSIVGNKE